MKKTLGLTHLLIGLALISSLTGCEWARNLKQKAKNNWSGVPHVSSSKIYEEPIPTLPLSGYILKKLGGGVYFFSNGWYNTVFAVSSEGVILIDPIQQAGALIKKAIGQVTDLPVRFIVYSHAHLDHIGDAHLFARDQNVEIIAHKETHRLLRRHKDSNRPLPHISFAREYVLSLGEIRVELVYAGDNHEKGNLIIYFPRSKVLMFVDVLTPKAVPEKGFATVDLYGQIRAIKKSLTYDFDHFVGGHFFRPGTKKEVREVLQYYLESKESNEMAINEVSFDDTVRGIPAWDLSMRLNAYENAIAKNCMLRIKDKWKSRLMGFSAHAMSHCYVWTKYHRSQRQP